MTGTGIKDLKDGVIKCPSDPDKTLSDDPSRILRAVKFIGRYDFRVPNDVMESIKRNAKKLKDIPHEAVSKILKDNIFGVKNYKKLIGIMRDLGIMPVISEIYNGIKPFRSDLDGYMSQDRKRVKSVIELMDDGMFTGLFRFLSPGQLGKFKEFSKSMGEEEAGTLMTFLYKPPVNNQKIIDDLGLLGPERSIIAKIARNVILEDINSAMDGNWDTITEKVKQRIPGKL